MVDEELRRRLDKHERDLYLGNGKPALCVRIAVAEERLDAMNRTVDEIRKDSKVIRNMVIGLILTVIGEIIVKLVVH